jgi:NADH-quinone oxidoreductase subunit A
MGSLDSYLPIFLLIVLGIAFAGLSFIASRLLAPQRPTAAKEAPYECGIVPTHEPANRFPVRFYLVAMIFIIFDIEVIFLFPWAVVFRQLGTFGLVEILVFAAAVFVSFVYLISNGALDWGPIKRVRPVATAEPVRTSTSTVRRHGPDGPSGASGEAA